MARGGRQPRWAQSRFKTGSSGKAALTPAKVREALILAEIVAPPRALRPYTPFPWRR